MYPERMTVQCTRTTLITRLYMEGGTDMLLLAVIRTMACNKKGGCNRYCHSVLQYLVSFQKVSGSILGISRWGWKRSPSKTLESHSQWLVLRESRGIHSHTVCSTNNINRKDIVHWNDIAPECANLSALCSAEHLDQRLCANQQTQLWTAQGKIMNIPHNTTA